MQAKLESLGVKTKASPSPDQQEDSAMEEDGGEILTTSQQKQKALSDAQTELQKMVSTFGPDSHWVVEAQAAVTQAESKINPLAVSKDRVSLENDRHVFEKKKQELLEKKTGLEQTAQKEIERLQTQITQIQTAAKQESQVLDQEIATCDAALEQIQTLGTNLSSGTAQINPKTMPSEQVKPIITSAKMDEFYNMVLTGLNANPEHKDGVRNMMKTNFLGIFGNDIISDPEEPSQASAPPPAPGAAVVEGLPPSLTFGPAHAGGDNGGVANPVVGPYGVQKQT